MARIPFLTRSLAHTIVSGEWDSRLPKTFQITAERLEKGQTSPPFITEEELKGSQVPSAGWDSDGEQKVKRAAWWSRATSVLR
jgi:hypothetical protein